MSVKHPDDLSFYNPYNLKYEFRRVAMYEGSLGQQEALRAEFDTYFTGFSRVYEAIFGKSFAAKKEWDERACKRFIEVTSQFMDDKVEAHNREAFIEGLNAIRAYKIEHGLT